MMNTGLVDMSGSGAASLWWDAPALLERVLADLLHAELRRLRPGNALPPAWTWCADTNFAEIGAVGVDSLELLSLSAAAADLMGSPNAELLAQPTLGGWCAVLRDRAQDQPPSRVPFRTSGSTGAPIRHLHALGLLEEEAACWAHVLADRPPGEAPRRIWSAVPLHHAYGFIHGVLLPFYLGTSGAALPVLDLRPYAPGALAGLLHPGDVVLGHPAWWEAVVNAADGRLPPGVVCVTSTAPCPPPLARAVLAMGAARLVQIYGSSETAGLGWRDGPDDAFTLLPCRDGKTMRSPEAAATLPDLLEWQDTERFRIVGRRDGAVQVAGYNVYPARVRDLLLQHPAVLDAAVRPMSAAQGGRLKAFVVPRPGAPAPESLRAILAAHASAALSAPEQPRSYSFGDTLPRDEMGKLAEWRLDGPHPEP